MHPEFKVGDQVVLLPSTIGRFESAPQRGIVVAVWSGKPAAIHPGDLFMDIQFDDGTKRTGFLNRLGRFQHAPLIIAPSATIAR